VFQICKLSLAVGIMAVLPLAPARMLAQDAAPAGQAPQKNWKDRAEYDLFDSITKDTNAKTRLEKLQQWEKQYPATDYKKERRQFFLTTYVALNQGKEAVDVAKQMLADDPKDFNALYYTMLLTRSLYGANRQDSVLNDGEHAAKALLAGIDTPPPGVAADQWAKLRPDIEQLSHVTLGFVAMQKKDWDGAEAELRKTLALNPNYSEVDYMLGFTLASKKNNSAALFYYARAAAYDGPGSLGAPQRQGVQGEVQNMYKIYHGNTDGLNDLLASAKSAPNPPDGFHIKSKAEIAKEGAEAEVAGEAKFAADHPDLALWKSIKEALTGPTGADYFEKGMKDAKVNTLKGKVVKLEPAVRPKTILLAMEDGTAGDASTADATLKLEVALPGKVDPGTELSFEGVPASYTASPLMVVFNVDKSDLHGWPKSAPAAPAHHKAKSTTSGN
jgi:tetratricopeptide (TPR) repeat protein